MTKYDLSIVIPARNEMFLAKTVENILLNKRGKTEIIIGMDGSWSNPPIGDHPDVNIIHYSESIGQRAITNQCVQLSRAKYVMKVDAHCCFDEGFDIKMMKEMKDDWTMIPTMYNLHAFDWICDRCNWRDYQGPTPEKCPKCGGTVKRDIIWKRKTNPTSNFYRFDNTLHFQYWKDYEKRPEAKGDIAETMSIQGSCFMITREKYWELDICDEKHGSWGQQGVEVAMKTWMSGGRLVVNKKTWYAHLFRTQGGDFGFPYSNPGVGKAREYSRDLWINNKWPKAKHNLDWLIEKFAPVPDWDVSKGIVYYTDNELDEKIMKTCQNQLKKAADQRRIVSVSLKKIDFGDNITMPLERGPLTMFKQILAGLKALDTDVVFLCEHDVLYHPDHFNFTPPRDDVYYYSQSVWQLRSSDGFAVKYDCKRLSQLCANREFLIKHYEARIKQCEAGRFSRRMGYEPGSHNREERVDDFASDIWSSVSPNVDIKHDKNTTANRWKQSEFRSQKNCQNWQEIKDWKVPGWNNLNRIL